VPFPGHWTTLLDTNATWFGGSGYGGSEGFDTERVAWHGFGDSALISLPPLAVVWFAGSTES
jgi:1,4-alpha-glucan branching enzyme